MRMKIISRFGWLALAVPFTVTSLLGGIVFPPREEPAAWPSHEAYRVAFGDFFAGPDCAPTNVEQAVQPSAAIPHANLYLIVSPPDDADVGCLLEPWKLPWSSLPRPEPNEEIEIEITPERWIPSRKTLGLGGKDGPDLAIAVNVSPVGQADSESLWVPLKSFTNSSARFYERHFNAQRLVFRAPMDGPVELELGGFQLERKRWTKLRDAISVLFGKVLPVAGGLIAPAQGIFGGTASILEGLRAIQQHEGVKTSLKDLEELKGVKLTNRFGMSAIELLVSAKEDESSRNKLARGRWLALANSTDFNAYRLRVSGLQQGRAALHVVGRRDGSELTEADTALAFDDYAIFDVNIREVPIGFEARAVREEARAKASAAAADFRALAAAHSELAYERYIARYEGSPLPHAAEFVSMARETLADIRAELVPWTESLPRNSKALLIGIGNFLDPNISPIPGIAPEIAMMREVADVLGISDVRELRDEHATVDGIRAALRDLAVDTDPDDLILVYFSGRAFGGALLPYDTTRVNLSSDDDVELANELPGGEFAGLLADIPSRHVLAIIDNALGREAWNSLTGSNVVAMVASGVDDVPAYGSDSGGLFTQAVHAALSLARDTDAPEPRLGIGEWFMGVDTRLVLLEAERDDPLAMLAGENRGVPRPHLAVGNAELAQFRLALKPSAARILRSLTPVTPVK